MFRYGHDPAQFRRIFIPHIALPIIAVLTAVVLVTLLGLYLATQSANTIAINRQIEMAKRAVAASVDQLAYQQQGLARRTSLVDQLNKPVLDAEWLDRNIAPAVYQMFRHDRMFILNQQDAPIFAGMLGTWVAPEEFNRLRKDVQPLIDAVRGRGDRKNAPHDRLAGQALAEHATVLTAGDAVHASDVAKIMGAAGCGKRHGSWSVGGKRHGRSGRQLPNGQYSLPRRLFS